MSALPRIDRKQAKEAVQKHSLFFHGIAVPAVPVLYDLRRRGQRQLLSTRVVKILSPAGTE